MSKDFLQPVDLTTTSLSKCVSDYGGINSSQHKAFLNEICLDEKNADDWLSEALQDRSFLNIHTFKPYLQDDFRVLYQIPVYIPPNCATKFQQSKGQL